MNNILVLTYWSFGDALVQTYTLPYISLIRKTLPPGSQVTLVTLEPVTSTEDSRAIESQLKSMDIAWCPFEYRPWGFGAFALWSMMIWKLSRMIRKQKISVVHCWATPAGGLGYLLSLITGATLIIDSFEPHAEAMVENGTWGRSSMAFRLLFALEKLQARRAQYLIAANAGMGSYTKEKYGNEGKKMLVKPACVNLELFSGKNIKDRELLRELGLENKIVCVYAGKLGGIYLDREVFDFLALAHNRWRDQFRVLLLTSHTHQEISAYCSGAGLDLSIVVSRFVTHRDVPRFMGLGDFALTPVKPVPTKRYCTPIKNGEYWALGLPVVIPANISDDSEIIRRHDIGAVLDRLDREAYLGALDKIDQLLAMPRADLRKKIREVASRYRNFEIADKVYRQIYGSRNG